MSTLSQKTLVSAVLGLGALCWAALPGDQSGPTAPATAAAAPMPVSEYRLTGPFSHDNLTVYLLHGPDTLPPRPILTLDEALAKNAFVVHETGTVNTLMVENLSDGDDVLIQPGDIVKGGRQDRLIASAMVVPAKSGKIAVPSFCVEHGRWTQRGKEVATRFAKNDTCIAGKDLKNAALVDGQQAKVWENVDKLQSKLSENVGQRVNCPDSPTSLQLALENDAVAERLKGYERSLGSILRGGRPAVGYVIAVNGKVTGAEVFGSSAVLEKAWPKALRSAAVEALAERNAVRDFEPCSGAMARAFLADAERGQVEQQAAAAGQGGRGRVVVNAATNLADGSVRQLAAQVQPAGDHILLGVVASAQPTPNPPPVQAGSVLPNPSEPAPVQASVDGRLAFRRNIDRGGNDPIAPAPVGAPGAIQPAPVQVNRVQGHNAVLVESRDAAHPSVVVHRSFIAK